MNNTKLDLTEKTGKVKEHYPFSIIKSLALTVLWLGIWGLHQIMIPKGQRGLLVYIGLIAFSIGVLIWLCEKGLIKL